MTDHTDDPARDVVLEAERLYADLRLHAVAAWKADHPGRPAIGGLPVYLPRELVTACGALAVGVAGGGDQIDVVRGDACFQSYICHLPRSTVEMALGGHLHALDAIVCPSTCDVIRNLSGLWQMLMPSQPALYLDLPQNFDETTAARFYRQQLDELVRLVVRAGGAAPTEASLRDAFARHARNRRALDALDALRARAPWLVPADEGFLVVRAGHRLDVDAHTSLVERYVAAAARRVRKREDRVRVVVVGAFCETPPLGLLRTLDRAGCYLVGDDLNLWARWLAGDIDADAGTDGIDALVQAYLRKSTWASIRYDHENARGARLVAEVRRLRADGVVFAAPSFCDPALLDRPPLERALADAGIPYTLFNYAENNGQFQSVREQLGTFSDSLRLWGDA